MEFCLAHDSEAKSGAAAVATDKKTTDHPTGLLPRKILS